MNQYLLTITFLLLSFSVTTEAIASEQIITYPCPENCIPEKKINKVLKAIGPHQYDIRFDGIRDESVIYTHYRAASSLPLIFSDDNHSQINSSLTCEHDADWSCNDWEKDELWGNYAMGVRGEINSVIYEFVFTESDVNLLNNLAYLKALTLEISLSVMAGGAVMLYVKKYGKEALFELLAAAGLTAALTRAIKIRKQEIKVGDILVISGGSANVVKRENSYTLPSRRRPDGILKCTRFISSSPHGKRTTTYCFFVSPQ